MTGDRLKLLRKTIGLTQEQLAQRLGIGKAALSMIETGKAALSSRNKNILVQELMSIRTGSTAEKGKCSMPNPI